MSTLREDILFCENQGSLYTRECVGDASSSLYLVVAAFPSYPVACCNSCADGGR
jgi:hypothetical protein